MEGEGGVFFKGDKGRHMRFHTYFKSASFLLVSSAFLSMILTGELEPPYTILIISGMAAGLMQDRFDISLLSRVILTVSIPFLIVDFFFISRDILYAFAHLLVLLTVARLVSLRTNSDYSQLYLLTFFDLLASSAMTINLSFAFTFTIYLVSATWVLLLFHIKKEVEGRGDMEVKRRELEGTVTLPFFLGVGGVAVLSLVITVAIFFLLPRVGVGLFFKRPGKVIKTSGFADKVDFGSVGPVELDPMMVMRVELPEVEKGMGSIYLRGAVLDYFNGATWEKERVRLAPLKKEDGDFLVYDTRNPLVRQEIILEPIDSRVIFGVPRLARLSGRFTLLFRDEYDAVHLPVNPTSRFQYTAYSDIKAPGGDALNADRSPYPKEVLDLYTDTPPLSGRVKELAGSITRGAEGAYRKAVAVDGYLKRNYSYTLNPGRDESLPPVEDFLFKNREGYCDHFSTAMAVLLRLEGIPSRLVTGYVTSEWNDLGRFYTVRQRNAHSWVEVYFPSYGWVPFDPTPPAAQARENIVLERIGRYIGYVRLRWDRYIINFTLQDQIKAAREARRRTEMGREAILRLLGTLRMEIRYIAIPAVLAAAAILLYLVSIRRWRWGPRKAIIHKRGKVPFYQEMLRILARRGIPKPDGMTPREFADHVLREKGEAYSGVVRVTGDFEMVRYGGATLSPREMEEIDAVLERLRKGK
jgi:transglutaminase-like putative cysteine protease